MSSSGTTAPLALQKYGTALSLGTWTLGLAQIFQSGLLQRGQEKRNGCYTPKLPLFHTCSIFMWTVTKLCWGSPGSIIITLTVFTPLSPVPRSPKGRKKIHFTDRHEKKPHSRVQLAVQFYHTCRIFSNLGRYNIV